MKLPHVGLLCLLVGCAGFFAGRLASGPNASASDRGRAETHRDNGSSGRERGADHNLGNSSRSQSKEATQATAQALLGQGLDSIRIKRWIEFLGKMSAQDAVAVAELLAAEKLEGRDYPMATTLFWQNWASADPEAAFAYARDHAEEGGRVGIGNVMKAWSYLDPTAAEKAFMDLDDPSLVTPALAGLARGLAESDPAAAANFAMSLPEKLQPAAITQISDSMVLESNVEEAQAWFDTLPSNAPLFQQEALLILLQNMTRRCSPSAVEQFAIDWANANPDHPATDSILAGTARAYLARGEAGEAAALLSRINDPALRSMVGGK